MIVAVAAEMIGDPQAPVHEEAGRLDVVALVVVVAAASSFVPVKRANGAAGAGADFAVTLVSDTHFLAAR